MGKQSVPRAGCK